MVANGFAGLVVRIVTLVSDEMLPWPVGLRYCLRRGTPGELGQNLTAVPHIIPDNKAI